MDEWKQENVYNNQQDELKMNNESKEHPSNKRKLFDEIIGNSKKSKKEAKEKPAIIALKEKIRLAKIMEKHKVIWCKGDESHHNSNMISKAWNDIKTEMKAPSVDHVKKVWKGCRDHYNNNVRKFKNNVKLKSCPGESLEDVSDDKDELSFLLYCTMDFWKKDSDNINDTVTLDGMVSPLDESSQSQENEPFVVELSPTTLISTSLYGPVKQEKKEGSKEKLSDIMCDILETIKSVVEFKNKNVGEKPENLLKFQITWNYLDKLGQDLDDFEMMKLSHGFANEIIKKTEEIKSAKQNEK